MSFYLVRKPISVHYLDQEKGRGRDTNGTQLTILKGEKLPYFGRRTRDFPSLEFYREGTAALPRYITLAQPRGRSPETSRITQCTKAPANRPFAPIPTVGFRATFGAISNLTAVQCTICVLSRARRAPRLNRGPPPPPKREHAETQEELRRLRQARRGQGRQRP